MAEIETLGILDEIEALVSDKLQVVSYKWLSRNFLVSSDAAKRLLEEFVEKHANGLEVVYTLSGWLRSSPPSYHIRLVSGPKLAEAKREFEGNCSIQVYSVQASIPKDPAALWNMEFVQAEELFKQPFTVDNCLRDNRFCGISNSFVKRNVSGTAVGTVVPQSKSDGIPRQSQNTSLPQSNKVQQPQHTIIQQPSPKVALQSTTLVKDKRTESSGTGVIDQAIKPSSLKEKLASLPASEKNGQSKSSSASGGSLANLWDRASSKSKTSTAPSDTNNVDQNPTVKAEAQNSAREAVEDVGTDDDARDVNFKRASNNEGSRKRRVVFDYSDEDEYEDAVDLASPDPPKDQTSQDQKQSTTTLIPDKHKPTFNKVKDEPEVKETRSADRVSNLPLKEEPSVLSKSLSTKNTSDNIKNSSPDVKIDIKDAGTADAPNSPKRRKVLKTWIDERGREVTEVVWEEEESKMKKADTDSTRMIESNTTKTMENKTVTDNVNRPPAAKKSPAVGSTVPPNAGAKTGSKKAGNPKDPKQGNILSFFKRV